MAMLWEGTEYCTEGGSKLKERKKGRKKGGRKRGVPK